LLDRDALFSAALEGRKVILGYYFSTNEDAALVQTSGALPDPVFMGATFSGKNVQFPVANGYGANLPDLQFAAWGSGHFNPLYDNDGVNRRIPLLIQYHDAIYESLSLAVARAVLGDPPLRPIFAEDVEGDYSSLEWLKVADHRIPVDVNAAMLVPYRSSERRFPYYSATDVLNQRLPKGAMDGKIVLLGTSAPGLADNRVTPVGTVYPGVEIHATAIAGILEGTIKSRPPYVRGVEVTLLSLFGLLLSFLLPLSGPLRSTFICLSALVLAVGFNVIAWQGMNFVLPISSQLLLIVFIFVISMAHGFFIEFRAKHRVAGLFGQYVPPGVVEQLQHDPSLVSMQGESREMTVLFSDVRSFTTISEGLSAPELAALMNAYMDRMTSAIQKYDGTVDKYIGDAIMAFWGAPLQDERHANKALLSAMEMQRLAVDLRAEFREKGWPELRMGIGLNTGVMNVGNMGSEFRRAYTVLGDAVNLGARLESISKRYGAGIVVSEYTMARNPGIVFKELDRIVVKGKQQAVVIYEPLCLREELADEVTRHLEEWQQILEFYRAQKWDEVESALLQSGMEDGNQLLAHLYLERVRQYRITPPPADWGGVYTYDSK
jgi:adenylate cyclase